MFLRFFIITLVFTLFIWYLHEVHTAQFMAVMKNIPYLTPFMVKIHSLFNTHYEKATTRNIIFTPNDLSKYNGNDNSKGTYIAIMGKVYDVQRGRKHYSPGGTYHIFAGRDGSRAFVTGEFTEDKATDDVLDLSPNDLLVIKQWQDFYQSDYSYQGVLIGRYFNEKGEKTDYHKKVDKMIIEAQKEKHDLEDDKKKLPPCNSEWSAEKGSRVWCTPRSGGIQREWAGVPRKLYKVGSSNFKCVCINILQLHDSNSPQYSVRNNLEEYEDCEPNSTSCRHK